jgi:hypothetical protein
MACKKLQAIFLITNRLHIFLASLMSLWFSSLLLAVDYRSFTKAPVDIGEPIKTLWQKSVNFSICEGAFFSHSCCWLFWCFLLVQNLGFSASTKIDKICWRPGRQQIPYVRGFGIMFKDASMSSQPIRTHNNSLKTGGANDHLSCLLQDPRGTRLSQTHGSTAKPNMAQAWCCRLEASRDNKQTTIFICLQKIIETR